MNILIQSTIGTLAALFLVAATYICTLKLTAPDQLRTTEEPPQATPAVNPLGTECRLKGYSYLIVFEQIDQVKILNPETGATLKVPKSLAHEACKVYQQ